MTRKRETLQGYFAGVFDGEGSIGLYQMNKGQWSLRVKVQMTDIQAVALLMREYPEGLFYKKQYSGDRAHHRPYYEWLVTGSKAERFLKDIKPYSIVKHGQIKLALSFLALRGREMAARARNKIPASTPYSDDYHRRAESLAAKLKQAKIPDANAVNSVNLLLDHEMREYRAKREDVEQDVAYILSLLEGVETSGESSTDNKPSSAAEKDIVQV